MSGANDNSLDEESGPQTAVVAPEDQNPVEDAFDAGVDDEGRTADENEDQFDDGGAGDVGLRAMLEAMFFAADEPLTLSNLLTALPEVGEGTLRRLLGQMVLEWTGDARGIHLQEIAGGYQLRTNPTYHEQVSRLFESKPTKLSRAAMETLAIIAYRQPVTKAVVDEIRGVDCGGVIRSLTDFELVAVLGKADDIGRPNLYGTTRRFLEFFGLASLTDLPTLEDFEIDALELLGEDVEQLLTTETEEEKHG